MFYQMTILMMIQKILCLFAVAFFSIVSTYAGSNLTITVPDTIVQRAAIFSIPIRVSNFPAGQILSAQVQLSYNPSLFVIRSIFGGVSNIFQCSQMKVDTTVAPSEDNCLPATRATLTVSCDSLKNNGGDGILFSIGMQALAGSETVGVIDPLKLFINGTSTTATVQSGKITIQGGLPIMQIFQDGLLGCYPNPIRGYSTITFDYSLADDTNVKFELFSMGGTLVKEFPEIGGHCGNSTFQYFMDPNISQGLYLMRMSTKNGAFFTFFEYLK